MSANLHFHVISMNNLNRDREIERQSEKTRIKVYFLPDKESGTYFDCTETQTQKERKIERVREGENETKRYRDKQTERERESKEFFIVHVLFPSG